MNAKELHSEIARISLSLNLLMSAAEMRNLAACKWYCDAYGQLGNDKAAKELYFWRDEENDESVSIVVAQEQKKICIAFEKLCEELLRAKVFGEKYVSESEDMAIDFFNLFLQMAKNMINKAMLRKMAQASEKVLSEACFPVRDMWKKIMRKTMIKNVLADYLTVMTDIFAARQVSQEDVNMFFALFDATVHERKIRL